MNTISPAPFESERPVTNFDQRSRISKSNKPASPGSTTLLPSSLGFPIRAATESPSLAQKTFKDITSDTPTAGLRDNLNVPKPFSPPPSPRDPSRAGDITQLAETVVRLPRTSELKKRITSPVALPRDASRAEDVEDLAETVVQPPKAEEPKPRLDKGKEKVPEDEEESKVEPPKREVKAPPFRSYLSLLPSNVLDQIIISLPEVGGTAEDVVNAMAASPELKKAAEKPEVAAEVVRRLDLPVQEGENPLQVIHRAAEKIRQQRFEHEARMAEIAATAAAEQTRQAILSFSERRSEEYREELREASKEAIGHRAEAQQMLQRQAETLRSTLESVETFIIKQDLIEDTRLWDMQQRLAHRINWPPAQTRPTISRDL